MSFDWNKVPEDADFVSLEGPTGRWSIFERLSNGSWNCVAYGDGTGWWLICAGIMGTDRSLWSASSGQFLSGTVEQLSREAPARL
jgi:hypothetical protein